MNDKAATWTINILGGLGVVVLILYCVLLVIDDFCRLHDICLISESVKDLKGK